MIIFIGIIMLSTLTAMFCWSFPCIKKFVSQIDIHIRFMRDNDSKLEERQLWVGLDNFKFYIDHISKDSYVIWCTNGEGLCNITRETRATWDVKKNRYKLHLVGII